MIGSIVHCTALIYSYFNPLYSLCINADVIFKEFFFYVKSWKLLPFLSEKRKVFSWFSFEQTNFKLISCFWLSFCVETIFPDIYFRYLLKFFPWWLIWHIIDSMNSYNMYNALRFFLYALKILIRKISLNTQNFAI